MTLRTAPSLGAALFVGSILAASPLLAADPRPLPKFERIVIDDKFPGGYQVEIADVNGDKKPDVVAVGNGTCAWYENPTWKKRIVTTPKQTPGIISSASADLDGDGKAEIAIGYEFEMNEPKKGKLLLASPDNGTDAPWKIRQIVDVPSIHRLRWLDWDGDGRLDLIVSPIFGAGASPPAFQQDSARLSVFDTGADPRSGTWKSHVLAERPVLHAIEARPARDGSPAEVYTADNLGVAVLQPRNSSDAPLMQRLTAGASGDAPKRGASEVHLGRLADGRRFLATLEPWHGQFVCISQDPDGLSRDLPFSSRTVIDDTLADGHALWVADVDGDGDDEVFAGHRGKDHRVSAYDFDGKSWTRTVLDPAVAAQDLRGGDIDGDGTPDVVAIGGATHNIIWYKPIVGR